MLSPSSAIQDFVYDDLILGMAHAGQASDSGYGSAVPSISEAAAQSKVGVDGRPEWMQRLEGMQPPSPGAQQADSSDEEDADEVRVLSAHTQ